MKLNNKGFAISVFIYGLALMGILVVAILMGLLSANRHNSSRLVKNIEQELNRFSKTGTSFAYSDDGNNNGQEYIVPDGESGWYRIELWGAQGGVNGGKGAYTSGIIELNEGDVLYFYIGKYYNDSSKGGQESDVRVVRGKYEDKQSYETRIMVAAGGATNANAPGGTLVGYTNNMMPIENHVGSDAKLVSSVNTLVGYNKSNYSVIAPDKTPKSPVGTSGGGDGYFPGTSGSVGGTSFISGYAGCEAIIKGALSVGNPKYGYYQANFNEDSNSYSYANTLTREYYFIDGMMYAGVNKGSGRAKIERVINKKNVSSLPRKNSKLDKVKYIRDCVNDSGHTNAYDNFMIQAIENGGSVTGTLSNDGTNCKKFDLGTVHKLDEIAVWHKDSGVDYKKHTIEVSENGSSWSFIKGLGVGTDFSETETVTGCRISAYQPDYTQALADYGNYYIMPVTEENQVLAVGTSDVNATVKTDYINDEGRQKWSIDKVSGSDYKIVELSRYMAMSLDTGNNYVYTKSEFSGGDNKFKWKIEPIGNGTYSIKASTSKLLSPYYNSSLSAKEVKALNNVLDTQRFKLISINYN